MSLSKKLFSNTRKPEGFLGKLMISSMNSGHAQMGAWGMSQFPKMEPRTIADLGCGGGRHAKRMMAQYPGAELTAVDYSEVSVEKANMQNRKEIETGRCKILQGDVSELPLPDGQFDLVTAFETVYFWPGPVKSFREAFRILESGGYFIITNESDGTNPADQKWVDLIDGMHLYPEEEMRRHLTEAGFTDISVKRNGKWICFISKKPERRRNGVTAVTPFPFGCQ